MIRDATPKSPSAAESQSTPTTSSTSTSGNSASVPTTIKKEPLPAPATTRPKKQTKRASSRRPAKKAVSPAPERAGSGGVMVHVAYADLPQVGEVLFDNLGRQSKYQKTPVIALCCNFVELKALQPTDTSDEAPIRVENGTAFNVILPPLDDRVVNVRVLAVGEIRGKQEASTKYRAAIIQRKSASATSWGNLETLNAADLPDAAHCEVRTHTNAHRAQQHIAHLFCKPLIVQLEVMTGELCMPAGAGAEKEDFRSSADQDGLRGVHARASPHAEEATVC
jgi:hypothetical protein